MKAFRGRRPGDVPREIARAVENEIQEHLRRRTEDLVAEGLSEAEARRRAISEFGDLDAARCELGAIDARIAARGAWSHVGKSVRRAGGARFTALLDDALLAGRRLHTRPGSALLVTVMLAMAIGLTAAMFTISDVLIFRPVPFHDPDELVVVEMPAVEGSSAGVNLPLTVVEAWRDSGSFEAVGGAFPVAGILEGGAEPVRRGAWIVTPGLVAMLGVRPLLGRTFVEGEGRAGSEETVVLSERVWRAEFSSDPSILGRVVEISGQPMRVVGVMPAEFRFPNAFTDLWVPLDAAAPRDRHRELLGPLVYARLPATIPRDDVLERARLVALDADDWADGRRVTTRPLVRGLDEYSTRAMVAVSAGVVLVFLVLCFNSANLLLGRLASRRREFATASALGASRGRLLRQALLEHAALGIGASVLGTGLGAGLLAWAQVSLPATVERFTLNATLNAVDLDGRAVLATSLTGLVATVFAGVLPAWLATSPQAAMWLRTLVDRTDTESRSARLFARALLVAQIAFAVTLLVGAGVLLRSFVNLMQRDLGLDAENVIVVDVSLPDHVETFQDRSGNVALVRNLVEELGNLAGVSAAALSVGSPPWAKFWWSGEFFGQDGLDAISFDRISDYRVTQTFFDVYGIPIIEGRAFRAGDGDESVILGERLARILWTDGTAVGSRLRSESMTQSYQVIGVAREIRTRESTNPADDSLEMYRFYKPDGFTLSVFGATISLRCSAGCPSAAALRQRIHAVNPRLLVGDVERVSAAYAELLGQPRAAATLATSFAVIALLTFASGLFSALHYAVGRRLPELGIRAALGASAATLGRTVLREGLSVALAGLACGGLAAWWLSSWLAAITYEAPSPDAITWIAVIGMVSAATLAGVWAPARRAMRADPLRLLRDQ
jgi:predicted permease